MSSATPALAAAIHAHLLGITAWPFTGCWLALYSTPVYDPETDTLGTELTGGGYERVALVGTPEGMGLTNSAPVVFTDLPGGPLAGVGIHDDPVEGNLLLYRTYETPLTLVTGQRFAVPLGDLAVTIGDTA